MNFNFNCLHSGCLSSLSVFVCTIFQLRNRLIPRSLSKPKLKPIFHKVLFIQVTPRGSCTSEKSLRVRLQGGKLAESGFSIARNQLFYHEMNDMKGAILLTNFLSQKPHNPDISEISGTKIIRLLKRWSGA